MRYNWESETMTKWLVPKGWMAQNGSNITRI